MQIVDVEDLSNLAETPVSVEIDEKLLNTGEVNLENDESKQHESGDGVKFVSLGDQGVEKIEFSKKFPIWLIFLRWGVFRYGELESEGIF